MKWCAMASGSAAALSGLSPEFFARSAVERLAAALEKALVGRVLNQRVLEAIGRLRTGALDEQEVRVDKAIERGLYAAVVGCGYREDQGAQQGIGEIASQHRPVLRHFARFAKPVEAGRERLLKRRRNCLQATGFPALEQKARDLLDEQWHAASAFTHPFDDLLGQRMARGDLADHLSNLPAVERGERDRAVMRAHAPGRGKLRPRSCNDREWRLGPALGESLHEIERSRISPLQVLESERDRL